MFDFVPMELPKPPENEYVIVQLVDDRYAFAIAVGDKYDLDWEIQLPFEEPIPVPAHSIKRGSRLPSNQPIRYMPRYGE